MLRSREVKKYNCWQHHSNNKLPSQAFVEAVTMRPQKQLTRSKSGESVFFSWIFFFCEGQFYGFLPSSFSSQHFLEFQDLHHLQTDVSRHLILQVHTKETKIFYGPKIFDGTTSELLPVASWEYDEVMEEIYKHFPSVNFVWMICICCLDHWVDPPPVCRHTHTWNREMKLVYNLRAYPILWLDTHFLSILLR